MKIINMRPPRIALVFTIVAAVFHWSLNRGEAMHFSLPWAGVLFGIAGFIIMMWAWLLFKKQDLAVCPLARTTHIAMGGPYRFTRNPMYLGFVLMVSGLALYIGTLSFYLSSLIYFAVLNFVFCPYEESKLVKAFGDEYIRCRDGVRRWV
jgi:protein-S-isoprenylcysteine O-methyltransferase Ste14